jgi:hypothetical protein
MEVALLARSLRSTVLVVVAALAFGIAPFAGAQKGGEVPSGGKAVAHRAGGKVVHVGSLPASRLYRVGHEAVEPTLGITKKGEIFYTAAGGATLNGVDVMRSTDQAESWKVVSPRFPAGQNVHPITLDPYVFVDEPTGRVFNIDLTVACSYMSFSDDRGKTWTTNPLACGRPINDHQTLFAGPPALTPTTVYDHIVYYCWNDFSAGSSCSKSVDGGISFHPTGSPAFAGYDPANEGEDDHCGGFHGHGVVGKDGTVYLPKEYCGRPFLGISHDEGATWEHVQVASNGTEQLAADTSIAVDAKGNLYYLYQGRDRLLYLVVSRDGGTSWTKPQMIAAPGVKEINLPTIDVGDPGKIAIAYMGSTNSHFQKCRRECTSNDYNEVTFNGYLAISVNALSGDPLFYSATVNPTGDPLIRGKCDFDNRCGPLLDFIDVEVSSDGTAYGSYVDACILTCSTGGPNQGAEGVVGRLIGGPKLR